MLLYIFKDGTVRQVEDNPTVADVLGVISGTLSIFKSDKSGYSRLAIGNNKTYWVKIKDSKTLSCQDGRIHQ